MCAVVGVYNCESASKLAYYGLFAMQHRGQEASGISSSDGIRLQTIKDRGLVSRIFDKESLKRLPGKMAIGHNRYSTAGDDSILDAQPVFARYDLGEMSVVHNGNLTNAKEVRNKLIQEGAIFQSGMDTENLIHLIARSQKGRLQERIIDAVKAVEGAFSFIFLSRSKMFVVRDRFGFRPLSLAKLGNGYIVASETCAFDLIGAKYIRDVEPGEMLIFEDGEFTSVRVFDATPKKCIFEYVYFARPDSLVYGQNTYSLRQKMGQYLAHELSVEADMVVPVPDSGVPAALGYAQESGIPFQLGIIRNHYVGRTFIEPTQEIRNLKVKMKLSAMSDIIAGKRLIVIDDSIVRGTTSKQIVTMLKEAGAKEVHMRISSPATSYPCFYGIDTPTKEELISNRMSVEEIRDFIGADSLSYLSLEGLKKSVQAEDDYCTSCFDGHYII